MHGWRTETGRDVVMAAMLGADEYGSAIIADCDGLYHGAAVPFKHLPSWCLYPA